MACCDFDGVELGRGGRVVVMSTMGGTPRAYIAKILNITDDSKLEVGEELILGGKIVINKKGAKAVESKICVKTFLQYSDFLEEGMVVVDAEGERA